MYVPNTGINKPKDNELMPFKLKMKSNNNNLPILVPIRRNIISFLLIINNNKINLPTFLVCKADFLLQAFINMPTIVCAPKLVFYVNLIVKI